jgi:hypothetical protein
VAGGGEMERVKRGWNGPTYCRKIWSRIGDIKRTSGGQSEEKSIYEAGYKR